MSLLEILYWVVSSSQPLIIGILAYIGALRWFSTVLFFNNSGARSRLSSYRFYECSTYSRLSSFFLYSTTFLIVMLTYIIYDVDLVLLISEVLTFGEIGLVELFVFALFVALFVIGLWYDYCGLGFSSSIL